MSQGVATLHELRAQAAWQGVEPDESELAAVRDFLAVFLPALDELSELLPVATDAAPPRPLEPE